MALISLEALKRHLRLPLDDSSDDADLEEKREAAEAVILRFISRPTDEDYTAEIEAWDEHTTPASVRAAVLMQATEYYRFRGDDEKEPVRTMNGLSPRVEATLTAAGYRRPSFA